MSDRLSISDASLQAAGNHLITASNAMTEDKMKLPGQFASLTGIGPTVQQYLENTREGSLALADAAKTRAEQVAGVMRDSRTLDRRMASSLQSGFAVKEKKK